MSDQDEFLAGGQSHPAVKFTNVGDKVVGTVQSVKKMDDKDPAGNVKTWPDGNPKHVFVFTVDTAEGETKSLWVRGQMTTAIREACYAAGVKSVEGNTLAVQFTGFGEAKPGMNAPKIYKAQVKVNTPTVAVDDLI